MAAPLKFILALDAKLGSLPALDKVLNSITKQLVKIDPGMKMTLRAFNALPIAAAGANKAVDAMGTGMGKVLGALGRQVGTFFRDAGSSFLGFATFEGLKAMGRGAIDLGVDMIKLSSIASETNRILSTIAGPADAKRIQALADAMRSATGIEDEAFTGMAAGLLRAGMAVDKLDKAFAIAADITALTPGLPDRAAKTSKALEVGAELARAQRKGGFDNRLLRGVGVSDKDFFGDIAKHMGVSSLEAQKRVEMGPEGGVKPDLIFGAIQRTLKKVTKGAQAGATADAMGKTPMAQLDRLLGSKEELFKGLADSKGVTELGNAFGRIADMLDPDSPNGKRIVDSLDQMLQSVAKSLAAIDIKGLSDSLINLFTKLPGLIEGTTKAGVAFLEFLGKLPGGKKEVGGPTAGAASRAGQTGFVEDVFNPKNAMSIAMAPHVVKSRPPGGLAAGVSTNSFLPPSVQLMMNALDSLLPDVNRFGSGIDQGVADGIAGGKAPAALFNMMEDLKAIPPAVLEMHSPSKVFERYGRMSGEGFAAGIEGMGGRVADATARAIPAPSQDIRNAKRGAGGTVGAVSVSAPITINYSGAGGEAAAQEIADMIKDLLPGQLQSAFTRIALETGTT
jgi:hypothetical protein